MQKGVFRAIETPQGAWTIIMPTNQMQEWGVEVSKATALEEMYLIYQAFRNYLYQFDLATSCMVAPLDKLRAGGPMHGSIR
jgi:hypothetical protein